MCALAQGDSSSPELTGSSSQEFKVAFLGSRGTIVPRKAARAGCHRLTRKEESAIPLESIERQQLNLCAPLCQKLHDATGAIIRTQTNKHDAWSLLERLGRGRILLTVPARTSTGHDPLQRVRRPHPRSRHLVGRSHRRLPRRRTARGQPGRRCRYGRGGHGTTRRRALRSDRYSRALARSARLEGSAPDGGSAAAAGINSLNSTLPQSDFEIVRSSFLNRRLVPFEDDPVP